MAIASATNCFPEGSWPKLIGFGLDTTNVIGVTRCSSSGELVLALRTKEVDLVGSEPDAWDKLSIAKFDSVSETYSWYKVINEVFWK